MLGMLFLLQETLSPTKPFLTWTSGLPPPLTGFLGLLAFVQSLKGALPSFLGPELHREIELGIFVCLAQ